MDSVHFIEEMADVLSALGTADAPCELLVMMGKNTDRSSARFSLCPLAPLTLLLVWAAGP